MRIVSWNCNLNLKSKFEKVSDLRPDILVVQECERLPEEFFPNSHYLWVGQNEKKGLGVLIFGGSGKIHSSHRHDLVEFIPVDTDFGSLLGVWAFNHRAKQRYGEGFDGATEHAITHYEDFIREKSTLGVVGDFNNSVIWDENNSKTPFQNTIERFERLSLTSVYHSTNNEQFGQETEGTLFHTKKEEKRYHIDYLFLRQTGNVTVGSYQDWIEFSDHVPIIVDIGNANQ
jgi:exonuclease III